MYQLSDITDKDIAFLALGFAEFYKLTPQDRRNHPVYGTPKNLCPKGRELYTKYCYNMSNNHQFFTHFAVLPVHNGCAQCFQSFMDFLSLLAAGATP